MLVYQRVCLELLYNTGFLLGTCGDMWGLWGCPPNNFFGHFEKGHIGKHWDDLDMGLSENMGFTHHLQD